MFTFLKALISFNKLSDPVLDTVCAGIMQSMTANANFTTPIPTLASIQTVLDRYTQSLADAATRERTKVALKNQYKLELILLMRQLGQYVNSICQGDEAKLTSSGFAISKMPQPRHITTPENMSLLPGINPGTLVSKIKAMPGASSYMHYRTTDPITANSVWISIGSSRSRMLYTMLQQGEKYWGKVAALGSNGQMTVSVEVSQFVL